MRKTHQDWIGALLTLAGGTCWGISGSIGQYLFTVQGMDSRWLVPVRLGLAGILLLGVCAIRTPKDVLRPWKNRIDARDLLIYGLAGVSMCQFLYFRTIQSSSAAIATILQDLSPVMILGVTCLLEHKSPTAKDILCIVLALAGVFFISTHGDPSHLTIPSNALVTGVLSAVCVTIYNVQPKRLLSRYPLSILQGWAFLMGSVFFSFVFRIWTIPTVITLPGAAGILFVVLIGNIFAFLCYMSGVKRIGPKKAILYGFSEPVTAAILTVLVFHQPMGFYDLLGFILIFFMIVILSMEEAPE
ncbi:MAG: EamA family transporter [Solobacterium sp.]|nr:EamA family transporter [Solobacterium sp.]